MTSGRLDLKTHSGEKSNNVSLCKEPLDQWQVNLGDNELGIIWAMVEIGFKYDTDLNWIQIGSK